MTEKIVSTTIEILGKYYSVRCPESDLPSLQEAASYLSSKMEEVQDSGKAINLERIAIISALNITHEFLQSKQQKVNVIDKINMRIATLQEKIDMAIGKPVQKPELIYSVEQI